MKRSWPAAALFVAVWAGVAFAQADSRRVNIESHVDAASHGMAIVTNLSSAPLTAWLIDIVMEPCSPLQPRSVPHAIDTVLVAGSHMIGALESRTEALGTSPCNKDGVATPMKAEFRAAIFADGTTAGDPAPVTMLLDNRRLVLEQYEAILSRLRGPAAATMTPEDLRADLRASRGGRSREPRGSPAADRRSNRDRHVPVRRRTRPPSEPNCSRHRRRRKRAHDAA